MFIRRIVAALLVAAPSTALGIVLAQWVPLPDPLNVQWSGAVASQTQPLWALFSPTVIVTVLGLGMAVAAVFGRDREDPYRGTLFIAAVLTASSAGLCIALLAINLGYAAPTGPAILGPLALAAIYALLPFAVVGIRARPLRPLHDHASVES